MKKVLTLAAVLTPATSLAHGLSDHGGVVSGLVHPLSGADHVIAMLAVGLLAANLGGRAVWMVPLGFVSALVAGGVLAPLLPGFTVMEPMILASLVVLGSMVALALRPALPLSVAMVALFGLAHGWAHGSEAPAQGFALYAMGFVFSTAALHLAGLGLSRVLTPGVVRAMGALSAGAGVALALA